MSFLSLRATLGRPGWASSSNLATTKDIATSDKLARESDVTVSSITPHAEYKGFFIYVISGACLLTWIGWALLPHWFLNDYLGIYYYPDKYWSAAIPGWSLIAMAFAYYFTALYNTEVKTLPLEDLRNFTDNTTVFAGDEYIHQSSAEVMDLPITLVNQMIYDQ
ncbi:hypothetical protein DICA3_F31802 [Diutina catenulata]